MWSDTASPHELSLLIAERRLLTPASLTRTNIGSALDHLLGGGADYADLYFQGGQAESWTLDDKKVSSGGFSISQGVGVRAVIGDQTAFAHSSAMTSEAINAASSTVRSMLSHGNDARRTGGIRLDLHSRPSLIYTVDDPSEALSSTEKIVFLQELDRRCRDVDHGIVRVSAQLQTSHYCILVAGSDGTLSADIRPQVQLSVTVMAQKGQRRAKGTASEGGRFPLATLYGERLECLVTRATRMALVNLDARPAPSGIMPVVLGPGFPGILLHEAVGHGLEADAHRKRSSVFTDRMGATIAAPGVTVVDDGTLVELRGSLNIDDEGVPTQSNILIENGRLTGLMHDKNSARLLKKLTTGNGRRQSYAHLPMPRMTNTYLASGNYDPQEIISSVKSGIYAADFGGGTVDITSGQFNFSTTEAYLIEDGQITAPIMDVVLIGLGHEALKHVSMVGNDLKLANGVCGKGGQSVPVCVGQPTIRINDMVVGGTA